MRNDYTPIRKAKKIVRAPPKKRNIQVSKKPIIMPPIVIIRPFFEL